MSNGVITKKHLVDIANAIRVKTGSVTTYTPSQMAAAIEAIDGSLSGTITSSTDMSEGVIDGDIMTAIADAIRTKLDVDTLYTPAQMAAAILSIEPSVVSWSSGTDAQLAAMIAAAHDGEIDLQQDAGWAIGDTRTIAVSAFTAAGVTQPAQNIQIVISSFSEYMSCGNVMQFDFKGEFSQGFKMNSTNTNVGGYGSSLMKTEILPALVLALPEWLKNNLIEFSVLASAGNRSSTIDTVTENKLALRSQIEITNSTSYSFSGEGALIPYYATSANRKKQGASGTDVWWTRSPYKSSNYRFVGISPTGVGDWYDANQGYGLSPFGCL